MDKDVWGMSHMAILSCLEELFPRAQPFDRKIRQIDFQDTLVISVTYLM